MNSIGVPAAIAVMLVCGFGATGWLIRRRPTDLFEVTGLAVLLGTATVSLLLPVVSLACQGELLIGIVTACALVIGISGIRRLRGVDWSRVPQSGWLIAGIIAATSFVAWQALAV